MYIGHNVMHRYCTFDEFIVILSPIHRYLNLNKIPYMLSYYFGDHYITIIPRYKSNHKAILWNNKVPTYMYIPPHIA